MSEEHKLTEEGGLSTVCEVMEKYEKIAVQEVMRKAQIEKEQAVNAVKAEAKVKEQQAVDAAKAEAKYKAKVEAIKIMINKFHAERKQILEIYTEEEYNQAIKELQEA